MLKELFKQFNRYRVFRKKAKPRGGHGIHSPFVYDLYTKCIDTNAKSNVFKSIEALRADLLQNQLIVSVGNFGAGSKDEATNNKTISTIAKQTSVPPYFGQLLYRLSNYFEPKSIIEFGTSLGISTSYLAAGSIKSQVISIEGNTPLANLSQDNFNKLGLSNVTVVNGEFDLKLAEILSKLDEIGMVFIDGNHTENATMRYFKAIAKRATDDTIIIFDDIRWNEEMENAWKNICNDVHVSISIDLFNCGLVFFRKGVVKQHFNLRYGPF